MTLNEVAKKLESQRNETIRNGYTPADSCSDETYGLNFSKIKEVAKEIEHDAVLADELYASTNHDMKVLATLIDDPKSYTLDELTKRADQLYPSPFADKFCRQVLANTDHAVRFINKWLDCEDCNLQAYAYITLSEIARKQNNLSDDFFGKHLERIERSFASEPDDVQQAMQSAIHAIAQRTEKLRRKAIEASNILEQLQAEAKPGNGKKLILEKAVSFG